MKNVLITGRSSYVGNSFANWVREDSGINIKKISLRDKTWRELDFSEFDTILHVAGIVHQKENKENENLYYQINRDLTIKLAKKAKEEGVSHFVFLSSMSVYGMKTGIINEQTPIKPKTYYGKSKKEAEILIQNLNDSSFKITIIRPPMIYGKNCKGNYDKLARLAVRVPIFPEVKNQRSMIYISNLCEFIKLVIKKQKQGIFHPQNDEYVCTSNLVKNIAIYHNKRIVFTKIFNPLLNKINLGFVKKVFGSLVYDKKISTYNELKYILVNFDNSVKATEELDENSTNP